MTSFLQVCLLAALAVSALCAKLGQSDLEAVLKRAEEYKETRDHTQPPQEYHDKLRALHEDGTKVKRGQFKRGVSAVSQATIYRIDSSTYVASVKDMCLSAHNYLRQQHKETSDLTYNDNLASESEAYAKVLVNKDSLVHSAGADNGEFGENLFVGKNTYGAVSTPAHAAYAWYTESWTPKDNVIKFYNYNFDPSDSKEFYTAGVGHFTATVWKGTKEVGCGVASTTYSENGFTWTKTVVVARYLPAGNLMNHFPQNVMPLKNGASSLKGVVRVGDCLPGQSKSDAAICKDRVLPSTCGSFKKGGFCLVVEHDCNCECASSA